MRNGPLALPMICYSKLVRRLDLPPRGTWLPKSGDQTASGGGAPGSHTAIKSKMPYPLYVCLVIQLVYPISCIRLAIQALALMASRAYV